MVGRCAIRPFAATFRLATLSAMVMAFAIAGCGGSSNKQTPATGTSNGLTVSCGSSTLSPAQTTQCSIKGLPTGHSATWSATTGLISPDGVFTAPATRGQVTVSAVDVLDSTRNGNAVVTVQINLPTSR